MLTVGSLFAGIGGFDLGLERAGFTIRWQVEIDPWCRRVLARHWPHVDRHADVHDFLADTESLGRAERCGCEEPSSGCRWAESASCSVDIICGGFPCQPVSQAGRQAGDSDDRWLWPEFRRVVSVLRPRWVLAENVRGLLSIDAGRLFGEILRDLAALGYGVEWHCIPAAALGAPHIRDRVWIIGRHDVSDAEQQRCGARRGRSGSTGQRWSESPTRCEDVADADEPGSQGHGRLCERAGQCSAGPSRPAVEGHWITEPDVDRVAHGIPARVDRLRALGNAVVPQVVEWLGRQILMAEAAHQPKSAPKSGLTAPDGR